MPRGDGTGPTGMGPMTGRAAGYCAGFNVPGFANPGAGRGFGGGFGRGFGGGGRGWRNRQYVNAQPISPAPMPEPQQNMESMSEDANLGEMILQQMESLRGELHSVKERLDKIES